MRLGRKRSWQKPEREPGEQEAKLQGFSQARGRRTLISFVRVRGKEEGSPGPL